MNTKRERIGDFENLLGKLVRVPKKEAKKPKRKARKPKK